MYKGIIYCFTSPSGKCYVGQTNRTLHQRSIEHCSSARNGSQTKFHRALRKYGIGAFKIEELCSIRALDKVSLSDLLNIAEKYYISYYKKLGISLYNLTEGGDMVYNNTGKVLSDDHKEKLRQGSKKWHRNMSSQDRIALGKAISAAKKKPIIQLDLDGVFIAEWPSQLEVPFMKQSTLSMCLTGRNKTAGGYKWVYKDTYEHISGYSSTEDSERGDSSNLSSEVS